MRGVIMVSLADRVERIQKQRKSNPSDALEQQMKQYRLLERRLEEQGDGLRDPLSPPLASGKNIKGHQLIRKVY